MEAVRTPERPPEVVVTDAALTVAVKTKLLADPKAGRLKIDVNSKEGVVTLIGTVKSQAEKEEVTP